jgi:hypothetical protein
MAQSMSSSDDSTSKTRILAEHKTDMQRCASFARNASRETRNRTQGVQGKV